MAPTHQHTSGSSAVSEGNATNLINRASSSKASTDARSSNSSVSYGSNNSRRSSLEGRTFNMERPKFQDCLLPIATRGLFHNDSFFEDARKNYDQAVKEVLDQSGQRSDQVDDLTSYRKMREFDLQDRNQAISVSEDEKNHKVVLDVRDFMKGDVKVKVIDENELVVEGSFEKQDGGSVSKKSFQRNFTFPGLVKPEAVSSAMSSDGVLTVTVPKNNQRGISSNNLSNQDMHIQKSNESMSNNLNHMTSLQDENNFGSKAFFNDITSDLLPVTNKGLFFQDSFFESARKDFEKSVQEVLNRSGETDSMNLENNMATYRNLREKNLKQENQAISVTEDNDHHKVVLDVKDFIGGDVKVKMVDENELKVEGKIEKNSEGVSSNKSFNRSFTFPGLIKADSVTSAMSSDGILTVTIPKEKQKSMLENNTSTNSIHSMKQDSANTLNNRSSSQRSNSNVTNESSSNNESNCFASESMLPVFENGLFSHDDFFASARQNFEKAVNGVVNNCGETTSLTDNMNSYSSLRDRDLTDDNQAVTTSEDHLCHKVVIDVRDFMLDDLKVKVVDENELVVEGNLKKKEGGSVSTKTFHRSFVFPGLVNSEAVSSTMSSDGVLIITVPKILKQQKTSQIIHSVAKENANATTSGNSSMFDNKHNISNQSLQQDTTSNSSRFQMNDLDQRAENVLRNMTSDDCFSLSHMKTDFHDDFFAKARLDFENASKKVFNHCDELTSSAGELNFFKDLHKGVSDDDNQSVSMSEDNNSHKVEIDVRDFVGGDLQVKALEQNELLVEGRLERDENGKTSAKSFTRRVQLPGVVRVDDITSVLSKDGVLVITAPKESRHSQHFTSTCF